MKVHHKVKKIVKNPKLVLQREKLEKDHIENIALNKKEKQLNKYYFL
jgi:hypothetical protein